MEIFGYLMVFLTLTMAAGEDEGKHKHIRIIQDNPEIHPNVEVDDLVFMREPDYYNDSLHLVADVPDLPLGAAGGRPGGATDTHSCQYIRSVPSELRHPSSMYPHGLTNFYQKYTEAYGIPVLGSRYLSDSALQRACYVVRFVLADSYDVRNSYYRNYGRFALMAVSEVTTNIPEHASLGAWWNDRARGLGATRDRPVSTAGEENALCASNDRYRREDIVLHEFAHGMHLLGLTDAVPDFDARLRTLYNSARSRGLWANTYALSTDKEYFAEGVQSYFGVEAYANPPDGIHNHVNTRDKLAGYDPGLYQLIREVFSCNNQYLKRCDTDRAAELNQELRLNCRENGGGGGGGDSSSSEECEDSDGRCAEWSRDGWCSRCSDWMNENCRVSCDVCDDGGGGGGGECRDSHVNCDYWADTGECNKNPAYMLEYCKQSCNAC